MNFPDPPLISPGPPGAQVSGLRGRRCYGREVLIGVSCEPRRTAARRFRRQGVALVAVAVLLAGCAAPDDTGTGSGGSAVTPSTPVTSVTPSTPVTSVTKIASAGVLGNQRRPDESCAPEPAALDAPLPRPLRHAAGETATVPDPQRIVVLAGDELDALCALGLQSRIVAAALPDGSETQPSYLGTVIHNVPPAGTRSTPDLAAVAGSKPDLILGSQSLTSTAYPELARIAPTVFTGPPGADWRENLLLVGAATGRAEAARRLVAGFDEQARAAALEALTVAALEGRAARAPTIAFLADFGTREAQFLRDKPDAGADLELLDFLVVCLADLGAIEHLPAIQEWFSAGLVDESYADPADIEADIRRSPAECRAAMRDAGRGLIDDIAHEAALWPAFHHQPPLELPPIPLGAIREPIKREAAKVGRNDPCPCGSGRKYKKCHGAA